MGPLRYCVGGLESLSAYPAPELEARQPTGWHWHPSPQRKTRASQIWKDVFNHRHVMKHRLTTALCNTQIQYPIRSASTPSDAHGNGHAINHRATTCAPTPSDAHGNGHALNHRDNMRIHPKWCTRERARSKSSENKHSESDNKMEEPKNGQSISEEEVCLHGLQVAVIFSA